jgi:hypothetical protein
MAWSVSAEREHRDKMPPVCSTSYINEVGMVLIETTARPILPITILEQTNHRARTGTEGKSGGRELVMMLYEAGRRLY